MVDSTPIRTLRALLASASAPVSSKWVEELRARVALTVQVNPPATDIEVEDILLAGRPAELIWAKGASPERLIYHLHGGGFVAGSPAIYRAMLGELSRAADAQVVALDYAKAPEHPFPAAYNDVQCGMRAVMNMGKPFAVTGDSAGGGLALSALLQTTQQGSTLARAGVLFSPWADLTLTAPSLRELHALDPIVSVPALREMVAAYAPNLDAKDPRLSPIFTSLQGLPPLLIQVGSDEALLDDALAIDRAARSQCNDVTLEVWPEMIHVWQLFTTALPQAKQALQRAGDFLKERLLR